ncbi:hypothetical protein BH23GEM8_BH23GEM8_11660 [soil metagenome]
MTDLIRSPLFARRPRLQHQHRTLSMLALAIFFTLYGVGRYALDARIGDRQRWRRSPVARPALRRPDEPVGVRFESRTTRIWR